MDFLRFCLIGRRRSVWGEWESGHGNGLSANVIEHRVSGGLLYGQCLSIFPYFLASRDFDKGPVKLQTFTQQLETQHRVLATIKYDGKYTRTGPERS
jgi:hypothetical protein